MAPRQSVDVIDIADASAAVADRGALARAKMQTLGCAKKDRKVQSVKEVRFRNMCSLGAWKAELDEDDSIVE